MNVSYSRASVASMCWRKAFNMNHRGLKAPGTNMDLNTGGAFHHGVAHGLATKNWAQATVEAMDRFDEGVEYDDLLPGEEYIPEDHKEIVRRGLQLYAENLGGEDYVVLSPELRFDLPLPSSEHNCIMRHHYSDHDELWGPPLAAKTATRFHPSQSTACKCWTPHHVLGSIDAIIQWHGRVWIMEHKTTSKDDTAFWTGFQMDRQIPLYMWACEQATGLKPAGAIVNALVKPSASQVAYWNRNRTTNANKVADYLKYSREAVLITPERVQAVVGEIKNLCDEWERRVVEGNFPMASHRQACMSYFRKCEFFDVCAGGEPEGCFDGFERVDLTKDFLPIETLQWKLEKEAQDVL